MFTSQGGWRMLPLGDPGTNAALFDRAGIGGHEWRYSNAAAPNGSLRCRKELSPASKDLTKDVVELQQLQRHLK